MQNTEVTYGHWKAVILPNNLTIIADYKYLIGDIVSSTGVNPFFGDLSLLHFRKEHDICTLN
jgi:hypothetical protein